MKIFILILLITASVTQAQAWDSNPYIDWNSTPQQRNEYSQQQQNQQQQQQQQYQQQQQQYQQKQQQQQQQFEQQQQLKQINRSLNGY